VTTPGGTVARGYGYGHRAARKHWAPIVAAGLAWCCEEICYLPDRWIAPGTAWDLAHTTDRQGYRGPAHPTCNRKEGAKRGYIAQQRSFAMRRAMISRW
jgi:hypothetical protein